MTKINLRGWHEVFDRLGISEELRNAGLLSREKDVFGKYVEHFVFHGMRHTFATWLGRSGVPIEIIKAIGGWSTDSKDRMVSIYTHIDDVTHLLPFVRNIDQILQGKMKI
jgi:integrase